MISHRRRDPREDHNGSRNRLPVVVEDDDRRRNRYGDPLQCALHDRGNRGNAGGLGSGTGGTEDDRVTGDASRQQPSR